jgi:hypothetical protein
MAAKGWLIGGSANASSTERPPSGGLFVCPDGMRLCRRAVSAPVRYFGLGLPEVPANAKTLPRAPARVLHRPSIFDKPGDKRGPQPARGSVDFRKMSRLIGIFRRRLLVGGYMCNHLCGLTLKNVTGVGDTQRLSVFSYTKRTSQRVQPDLKRRQLALRVVERQRHIGVVRPNRR